MEFDAIDASVPVLVMNCILCALVPLNLFAPVLGFVLFLINFFIHWAIQIHLRLPQYTGLSDTRIKAALCGFKNITMLFIFSFFAVFYTSEFPAIPYARTTTPESLN